MKVLLDACVLYPTVMREVLIGAALAGLYQPLWSDRILEEWARAARKIGPEGEAMARGEIALLRNAVGKGSVAVPEGLIQRLWLPDPNDIHVLAAAVAGSADILVTLNKKDFPQNILQEEGVVRRDPDGFLLDLYAQDPDKIAAVAQAVLETAEHMSGETIELRRLLKKARLPRLGKTLQAAA